MITLWNKFYKENQNRIIIGNDEEAIFRNGDDDIKAIEAVLEMAYNDSGKFRDLLNAWVVNLENDPITINFGENRASVLQYTSNMVIDVQYCESKLYISNTGKAVKTTLAMVLIHELMHILTGNKDNGVGTRDYDSDRGWDYRGENVIETNKIYRELGIIEENSYISVDRKGPILVEGTKYTNGATINCSVILDETYDEVRDWNTSSLGDSDDLIFGSDRDNVLISGDGDDFLYGMGYDDYLYGGEGNDVIYGDDKEDLLTGDDHLYGGSGLNYLYGGKGDDSYYIGEGFDIINDSDHTGKIIIKGADGTEIPISGEFTGMGHDKNTGFGIYTNKDGIMCIFQPSEENKNLGILIIYQNAKPIAVVENFNRSPNTRSSNGYLGISLVDEILEIPNLIEIDNSLNSLPCN